MDSNATDGFRKLSHLLQSPPFPPPTFNKLLMLYCKPQHAFYDLAAAVMADNPELVASSLSKVCSLPLLVATAVEDCKCCGYWKRMQLCYCSGEAGSIVLLCRIASLQDCGCVLVCFARTLQICSAEHGMFLSEGVKVTN